MVTFHKNMVEFLVVQMSFDLYSFYQLEKLNNLIKSSILTFNTGIYFKDDSPEVILSNAVLSVRHRSYI